MCVSGLFNFKLERVKYMYIPVVKSSDFDDYRAKSIQTGKRGTMKHKLSDEIQCRITKSKKSETTHDELSWNISWNISSNTALRFT